MYHDRNGKVAGSRDAFVAIIAEQCEARAPGGVNEGYRNRRELVPGSRVVRRLGDWGALEEASPIFYEWRAGREGAPPTWEPVGGARSMHLWPSPPAGPRPLTTSPSQHGPPWE